MSQSRHVPLLTMGPASGDGPVRISRKVAVARACVLVPAAFACAMFATACSKSADSSASATATPAAVTADASAATSPATADPSAAATSSAANPTVVSDAAASAPSASTAPSAVATVAVSFSDVAGNINAPGITNLAQLGALDATSGAFHPDAPIERRDFVRWLFKANNAVFADAPSKQIHPAASDETAAFSDLAPSDPDFPYVQGMSDAGISVGFPDKTFEGDRPITREQALAIKSILDRGGVGSYFAGVKTAGFSYYTLPAWKDKKSVSITYVGPIAQDIDEEGEGKVDNIGRTFGTIATFRPQAKLTRGEAATLFGIIGGHDESMMYANAMRSVATTLHPVSSPSP